MLYRRYFLYSSGALLVEGPTAWAHGAEPVDFVRQFGNQVVAVINGTGSAAEKQRRLEPLIADAVDIEAIGRFVLGRFWSAATPPEQQEFLRLFNQVLLNNVAGRLGEYSGVGFAVTNARQREVGTFIGTTITRPNQQSNDIQWVVVTTSDRPRIVDVIAEGTSLRLTQRNDYASFISRNGNQVGALLEAMRRQVTD